MEEYVQYYEAAGFEEVRKMKLESMSKEELLELYRTTFDRDKL